MAKKIRKRTSSSIPPMVLFVELLAPWVVMGIMAAALTAAGVEGTTLIIAALGSGLAATAFIGYYERTRKMREIRFGQSISRKRP